MTFRSLSEVSGGYNDDGNEKDKYQSSYCTGSVGESETSSRRHINRLRKFTSFLKGTTYKEYVPSRESCRMTSRNQGSESSLNAGFRDYFKSHEETQTIRESQFRDGASRDTGPYLRTKDSPLVKYQPLYEYLADKTPTMSDRFKLKPKNHNDVEYPHEILAQLSQEKSPPSSPQHPSSAAAIYQGFGLQDDRRSARKYNKPIETKIFDPKAIDLSRSDPKRSKAIPTNPKEVDSPGSNYPKKELMKEEEKYIKDNNLTYQKFLFKDQKLPIWDIDPNNHSDNSTTNISVTTSNKSYSDSRRSTQYSKAIEANVDKLRELYNDDITPKVLERINGVPINTNLKNDKTTLRVSDLSKSTPITVPNVSEPLNIPVTAHNDEPDFDVRTLGRRVVQIRNFTSFVGLKSVIAQLCGGPLEKIVILPLGEDTRIEITDSTSYINLKNCILELWFLKVEDAAHFMKYSCSGMFLVNGFHYAVQWASPHRVMNDYKCHVPPSVKLYEKMVKHGARRCIIIKNKQHHPKTNKNSSTKNYQSPKTHYSDMNFEELRRDFRKFGEILEVTPVISRRLCVTIHYFNVQSAIDAKEAFDDEKSVLHKKYADWGSWYGKDPAEKPCINV